MAITMQQITLPQALHYWAYMETKINRDFDYDPPSGGFVNHDETEYGAITWNDSEIKPGWETINNSIVFSSMFSFTPYMTTKKLVQDVSDIQEAMPTTEDLEALEGLATLLAGKVDKVTGKQLSTEDYTTAEKSKLAGIAPNATAFSGSYDDLSNKPATFPPSSHMHVITDVTNLDTSLAAKASRSSFSALSNVPAHAISEATNNLTTNYSAVTALTALITAVNATNTAYNDLATRFNTLLSKITAMESAINSLKTAGAA